jgi:hypothetical protein
VIARKSRHQLSARPLLSPVVGARVLARVLCSQNGYLSGRGGCQNRWHSLVNCDHGDSTTSRLDSPVSQRAVAPTRGASTPWRGQVFHDKNRIIE